MCVFVWLFVCVHVHAHVCMSMCVYMCMCMCVFVYYTCAHIYSIVTVTYWCETSELLLGF